MKKSGSRWKKENYWLKSKSSNDSGISDTGFTQLNVTIFIQLSEGVFPSLE